jgi:hypothetical protein
VGLARRAISKYRSSVGACMHLRGRDQGAIAVSGRVKLVAFSYHWLARYLNTRRKLGLALGKYQLLSEIVWGNTRVGRNLAGRSRVAP